MVVQQAFLEHTNATVSQTAAISHAAVASTASITLAASTPPVSQNNHSSSAAPLGGESIAFPSFVSTVCFATGTLHVSPIVSFGSVSLFSTSTTPSIVAPVVTPLSTPPIPGKLEDAILQGEYVDFADLLPDSIQDNELQILIYALSGSLVISPVNFLPSSLLSGCPRLPPAISPISLTELSPHRIQAGPEPLSDVALQEHGLSPAEPSGS